MVRTRFIFGVSVLCLAAGVVLTGCKGLGDTQKPTQTTTPPKATASPTRKTTKPPAKTSTPSAKARHTAPPAAGKTQAPPATPPRAANAAATKTPPPPKMKSPAIEKTTTTAKATNKPTDKTQTLAKAATPARSEKTADTKLAKADKPKSATTTASMPTKVETGMTATQLTPVQEKLKQNTNLTAKIASRLPAGTDVVKAADGFSNLGQFVAAVNVSNNLQLSFPDLKSKLVDSKMSLAQAIQAVRPLTASPTIEAQRAEYDARGVIAESDQQPAQSTTSGTTTVANKPLPSTTTTASRQKTNTKKPAQ